MHSSRVQPKLVDTKRLDPDYYHPQHLADEELLRKFGSDVVGRAGKLFAGPFGSKLPSSLYLDEGVPLFRVSNVGSMEVDLHDMAYLDESVHAELSASEVRSGDLLIVKASVGEKICKVPASMTRANITQHIIALRPNDSVDTDYLAAFLFGTYGRRQLTRRSLGSIIQYLGVSDTRTVLYPKIHKDAQLYIGEKVRQAERLRRSRRLLRKAADSLVEGLITRKFNDQDVRVAWETLQSNNFNSHTSSLLDLCNFNSAADTVAAATTKGLGVHKGEGDSHRGRVLRAGVFVTKIKPGLLRSRLDPGRYHPTLVDIRQSLKSSSYRVSELRDVGGFPSSGRRRVSSDQVNFFISILHIDGSGFLDLVEAALHKPEGVGISCLEGDVLISCINPKENRIALFNSSSSAACSPEFEIFRANRIDPHYSVAYLRSYYGLQQLIHLGHGTSSSRRRVSEEELQSVLIPEIDTSAQAFIGYLWKLASRLQEQERYLILAAKFWCEALIEGKVAEGELREAQEGLERGDTSADRTLLSRLTRKGIDAAGEPPLFPDLDALYQALEQVTVTDGQLQEA